MILGITRLGIMTPHTAAALAALGVPRDRGPGALLPTVDPVTMLIQMVPLIVLYELSIVLAAPSGRPPESRRRRSRARGLPLSTDHH